MRLWQYRKGYIIQTEKWACEKLWLWAIPSEDLTGRTFNHLKVTGYFHSSGHKAFWNCLCDCRKTTVARSDYLKNGNTVSCGCIAQQTLNAGRRKLKKAFVNGTSVSQISPSRKLNSNNKTGV